VFFPLLLTCLPEAKGCPEGERCVGVGVDVDEGEGEGVNTFATSCLYVRPATVPQS
jgi:hypothetical protein